MLTNVSRMVAIRMVGRMDKHVSVLINPFSTLPVRILYPFNVLYGSNSYSGFRIAWVRAVFPFCAFCFEFDLAINACLNHFFISLTVTLITPSFSEDIFWKDDRDKSAILPSLFAGPLS